MPKLPKNLLIKLENRKENNSFRQLPNPNNRIDFSSNDYLGFAINETIYSDTFKLILKNGASQNGATGSRLLSGNYLMYTELEEYLAEFYACESTLVFNSGYDANLGFFSAVPQRGDVIFYDEYIHASIRDGIQLSNAKNYKFKHNDLEDLIKAIERCRNGNVNQAEPAEVYIVTESVFSMDGDSPDLEALVNYSRKNNYNLVIDEAHALGVFGLNGEGLVQQKNLQKDIFARIVTFGKALGCHGAAILGSEKLKDYLVNFSRSFIYTTGLPPHSIATIKAAFSYLISQEGKEARLKLEDNIVFFNKKIQDLKMNDFFIPSSSAIQCCLIPGNTKVKKVAAKIQEKGFNVRPILSPTVPEGEERLRLCLHSYNSKEELGLVLQLLSSYL
ncbi:MAG: 8-amino-7-oxononanoate synthase [Flavobacteriaceae bacterium]|nr:MAG: 8-amino-7-oxononanoate synthase [Flavobacteriaceae bacterium]